MFLQLLIRKQQQQTREQSDTYEAKYPCQCLHVKNPLELPPPPPLCGPYVCSRALAQVYPPQTIDNKVIFVAPASKLGRANVTSSFRLLEVCKSVLLQSPPLCVKTVARGAGRQGRRP